MNIHEIFKNNLYELELYSFEDFSGDFPLQNLDYFIGKTKADSSPLKSTTLNFTEDLKGNLFLIYDQVKKLTINWSLSKDVKNETLDTIDWLNTYRIENELDYDFLREQLSGTINLVSLEEMFDRKKYNYLMIGKTRYLPFDHHFSLIACFKQEEGKIEDNIYIVNTEDSDKIIDMKISCITYLELAYSAKLFYYWQYAYLFKESDYNKRLNIMLPIIFPNIELDLSKFQ